MSYELPAPATHLRFEADDNEGASLAAYGKPVDGSFPAFTALQVLAAYRQGLEDAAKKADRRARVMGEHAEKIKALNGTNDAWYFCGGAATASRRVATAIRALSEGK